ncbi:folylpolyglutamate synthase [Schaereria dolodes]|nr:folylpolyglutamate synthase [Schaereria dolodes]
MLELGLARIRRLLSNSTFSWRAIHVAGTNGKGSVCAYVSAMLHKGSISCGRFTSPHLMDRWDCITINEEVVDESLFREVEERVSAKNREESIKASEFELLTATAFEIFAQEKIEIGVVEVGLGGRLDATNVLIDPLATIITKIGKDHERLLGNDVEEIARQKAGIMKEGVPCVIDGTNPPNVLQILTNHASTIRAGSLVYVPLCSDRQIWSVLSKDDFEYHQQINICLAFEGVKQALKHRRQLIDPSELLPVIRNIVWPGRLQNLSIQQITSRKSNILLDGAHNPQSSEVLGMYVDTRLRRTSCSVTWIIAASKEKDLKAMLSSLMRSGDSIVAVQFGPVEGMPWVQPIEAQEIVRVAKQVCAVAETYWTFCLTEALRWATEQSNERPLVVAGSLYLVSDVLRLLRNTGGAM